MRKIKEVLRLRFELKLGQRQIARSCSISQATVHEYLRRASAAGLSWPLADDWDDTRLERVLFGSAPAPVIAAQRSLPDFAAVHEQLKKHRHVTLRLVWEEYRQTQPDGTDTASSANCISSGDGSSTWCCDNNTRRARSYSSIGQAWRSRCTIR
jgi:hypothetical protein